MKWCVMIGLTVVLTVGINAQEQSSLNASQANLNFYVDHACFKLINQNDLTYVQAFLYIPRNELRFTPKDSFYIAAYRVHIKLIDDKDTQRIIEKSWSTVINDRIEAADTTADVPLLFESNFAIKPSLYRLHVAITDSFDIRNYGISQNLITVPDFSITDLQVSDVQLATQIIKGGTMDDMFFKNGYVVIPNPSVIFGSNLPRMFVYAEVYNLSVSASDKNPVYTAEFIVTDQAGSVIKEFPSKQFKKSSTSAVILHSLNIVSLYSGKYYLTLRITDESTKKVTVSKKQFIIYREGESVDEIASDDSFFKDLDSRGAEMAENVIYYLATDNEKKILKQLDLEGKKKFFDKFWKDRDPSPGTKANENLIEYYKRYAEVNAKFGTPNRAGWRTDMGRIYMIYGPPSQIEKHEFEPKVNPYQIWYYLQLKDEAAEVQFIFSDKDGSGNMQLIHSTARGELRNKNWLEEIKKF